MFRAATLLVALVACGAAVAEEAPRLVLKGYDPVAYFTESRPVAGNPGFTYNWDGGRYHFASAKNREVFAADPDRYAPRFGGHCLGSLSRGKYNEGDPHAWIISDGKLYVFGQVKFRDNAEKQGPDFLRTRIAGAETHWRARK